LKDQLEIAMNNSEWEKIGYLNALLSTKYKLISFWSTYFWSKVDAIEIVFTEDA
jgi:hypothetical protein